MILYIRHFHQPKDYFDRQPITCIHRAPFVLFWLDYNWYFSPILFSFRDLKIITNTKKCDLHLFVLTYTTVISLQSVPYSFLSLFVHICMLVVSEQAYSHRNTSYELSQKSYTLILVFPVSFLVFVCFGE